MSSSVTITIPTYNRHRQLARLLDYYSGSNFPIIVGDSTTLPFTEADKYKNVKYYHYPNLPYAHKLPLIYKKVKTKYVLFCADDDFIIPSAIKKCVRFLEKNNDYNCAHGHYIFFEEKGAEISAFPFYLESMDLDINLPTPSERFLQIMSNYMQLLYAVTKTKDVMEVFEYLSKNPKIKNDNLVELLQAIILCINGKSKTLPILYCAREITPNSARTHTAPLEIIHTKDGFKQEYTVWKNVIASHLMRKGKLSKFKAQLVVTRGINNNLKGLILTVPFIKIPIYTLLLQRFIITSTLGLAKKFRDMIYPPKAYKNLSNHSFMTASGKKEFEKIKFYIKKYVQNSM